MANRQYVSTIETTNNTVVMTSNQTDVRLELGQARNAGHSAYVSSTYAARYNFAAKQYNNYETDTARYKRFMRGGRFFLFNIIILIVFVASIVCGVKAREDKALGAVPIIFSILYLVITCYNWHIHRTNGSLIHSHMIKLDDRHFSSANKHIKIPVHARIENRQILAASDGNTTAILARLQHENQNLDELEIMIYGNYYLKKYVTFQSETILHFLLFLVTFIVAISQMSNSAEN